MSPDPVTKPIHIRIGSSTITMELFLFRKTLAAVSPPTGLMDRPRTAQEEQAQEEQAQEEQAQPEQAREERA